MAFVSDNDAGVVTELSRYTNILTRINKLTTVDRVRNFFMDIVNQFDDYYSYDGKKKGKKRLVKYMNFSFNYIKLDDHAKTIQKLRIPYDQFDNPMREYLITRSS